MNKTSWVIVTLFLLSTVTWTIYYYTSANKEPLSSQATTDQSVSRSLTQFVDLALDEVTDTYNLTFHCSTDQQTCAAQHDQKNPPHMGYAIMSLTLAGHKANDERLINKAATILDKSIEKCMTVDPRYCEWNFFPLHLYYVSTGDEKYLKAMLEVEERVMSERLVRELVSYNLPVKWWRLHDATGKQAYLDRLKAVADQQLESYPIERENDDLIYTQDKGDVRKYDLPMIWALYIPAYEASGDTKYLEPAIDFFKTADLSQHIDAFFDITTSGDLAKGTEVLLSLAKADPENKDFYLDEAKKILEAILAERWDTPEHKLINGDYGILVSPTEKATNIQGWLAYVVFKLESDFGIVIDS